MNPRQIRHYPGTRSLQGIRQSPLRSARGTWGASAAALLLTLSVVALTACGGDGADTRATREPANAAPAQTAPAPDVRAAAATVLEGIERGTANSVRRPPDLPVRPVERDLSPEALGTYAYLRAIRSILEEDEAGLLEAGALAAPRWSAPDSAVSAGSATGVTAPASPDAAGPAVAQAQAAPVWPAQAWLDGGVWLMSRKSPNSVIFLEQALSALPEDMSLNLLHAEALGEHGMAARGAECMRAYLLRHPDALDARLELALLLVKDRQFHEAESLLTAIPARQRTPLVDYYHARALIGMDRRAEAIPLLRRAVKGMPDFVEALAELAFVLEQEGELREARTCYEKLARLHFSPQDVALRLVNLSLRLKQPEKALQYIQEGPETMPFRLTAVSMLMDARHYLQAERLLKQIAGQKDAPDDVYLLLADLAFEQRRNLDMALAWLDKVPPRSKSAARARLLRVQLLAEAGRAADAEALARRNVLDFPDNPDMRDMEIRILAREKKTDAALAAAAEAVKRWPDNAELAFLYGSLLDESGRKPEALDVMEGILKTQPDNFQALNYVGYTLAEQNRDLERALALLTRADALSPNQAYIVDSLAWALFRAGKANEALNRIRQAVTLEGPIDATIWEHYGDIARHLGHAAEARKAYQKALDLKPDNAEALRQRLGRQ